jgi:hypothetical protein
MSAPRATLTEDLTSQVDGIVDTFTISTGPFISDTLEVELNGVRLRKGSDHDFVELTTSTFQLFTVTYVGDHLLVQFEIEDNGAGFPLVTASGMEGCC